MGSSDAALRVGSRGCGIRKLMNERVNSQRLREQEVHGWAASMLLSGGLPQEWSEEPRRTTSFTSPTPTKGMETIMDDEVTERFSAEELESWNLLSRTNYNLHSISLRLKVLWGLGVLIRYCFLLPLRFKEFVSKHVHSMCHRICARALTAIITYHDREDRPRNGGICVANHTSPIDVIILASDGYYTMVGQVHGGLMGVIQRAMVKACPHIWLRDGVSLLTQAGVQWRDLGSPQPHPRCSRQVDGQLDEQQLRAEPTEWRRKERHMDGDRDTVHENLGTPTPMHSSC
ncbi:glycerol-3-phosphate acyltransferase 4-like isoform X12 [Callithrix jacchus]